MPHLFCFGLGYTALRLALSLRADGWTVGGTVRSPEKADSLAKQGIETWVFDRDRPLRQPEDTLRPATHLLLSAPPGPRGDPVLVLHGDAIAALAGGLDWVGYLSTTGVYGDRGGDWVDEDSALTPTTERGRRRLVAETAWRALHQQRGLPLHIFRLAGIYGPGRSAIDAMRAGRARSIRKPGQVFNRIHVDDIVAVLRASIAQPDPGGAYNCADDLPTPSAEVTAYAAGLIGLSPPEPEPFATAEMSEMARSFYAENKRVRNLRVKERLGVTLTYPNYRAGLDAQLADETAARSAGRPR